MSDHKSHFSTPGKVLETACLPALYLAADARGWHAQNKFSRMTFNEEKGCGGGGGGGQLICPLTTCR